MDKKDFTEAIPVADYVGSAKDVATPIKAEILIEALPYPKFGRQNHRH